MIFPTEKQFKALRIIYDYLEEHGYSPAFVDIANGLGTTKPAAFAVCKFLREINCIKWTDGIARSITVTTIGKRILEVAIELAAEKELPEKYLPIPDMVNEKF